MDDSRLLQLICWAMSMASLSVTPAGGGVFRREDVWQMIGACRRFVNDFGPELLIMEALRNTRTERIMSGQILRIVERNKADLQKASEKGGDILDPATGHSRASVLKQAQSVELASIQRTMAGDTSTIEPPMIDVKWTQQRLAWACGRLFQRRHSKMPSLGLLESAADYALAHLLRGRYAGELWTVAAVAKRARWIDQDEAKEGRRAEIMGRICKAAEDALAEHRDEAMSRFRREVLAARKAA